MKRIFATLLFPLLITHLAQSAQNLCDDAAKEGLIFANDPAECNRYLYCERDGNNQITAVYQMICEDPKFPNFFEDYCYATEANGGFECVEGTGSSSVDYPVELCPNSAVLNALPSLIRFADPEDNANCVKSKLCHDTIPFERTCPGTLLFDRNSGQCALPEYAPCGPINSPVGPDCSCPSTEIPDCSETTNIRYPNDCYTYATCDNGVQIATGTCRGPELQFNPTTQTCDRADNVKPPCPYLRLTKEFKASLPRAQPKSRIFNPLIPQLNRIIGGRLQHQI